MLNWMNPQWQVQHPEYAQQYGYGAGPAVAPGTPTSGIVNPFTSGFNFSDLVYDPPDKAKYNPNAASPLTGTYHYQPRAQLAQIMAGAQQPLYGQGKRGDYAGMGSGGAGYSTSGPQSGRFGYGGGSGGWGRNDNGRTSSLSGRGLF